MCINVGRPEQKTWWRNLRERSPIEFWLAGRHHRAAALTVLGETNPVAAATGLEA